MNAIASGSSSASGLSGSSLTSGAANPAVDDEVRDVDPLRREFAGQALRQSAQREFAHRERRRLRVAFDARRRTRQQDRAVPLGQHPCGGLLRDQKRAERGDLQRALDVGRYQLDEWPARARAGVVDDHVRRAMLTIDVGEQSLHLRLVLSVAARRRGRPSRCTAAASLAMSRAAIATASPSFRSSASERRAQTMTGADDQRGHVSR